MFGISAFAQTPFASLAGNVYALTLTENFNSADASSQVAAFLLSLAEAINSVLDVQSEQDNFFEGIVETLTQLDKNAVGVGIAITENSNQADTPAILAQFAETIAENSTPADVIAAGLVVLFSITENSNLAETEAGILVIINSIVEAIQSADSTTQQSAFLEAVKENTALLDYMVARGWIKINDNQTITWVNINDSQTPSWYNAGSNQSPNWVVIDDSQG